MRLTGVSRKKGQPKRSPYNLLGWLVVVLAGCSSGLACGQAWPVLKPLADQSPLRGTTVLEWEGDLAMRMVDGIDGFMDGEIAAVMTSRGERGGTREELARKLGVARDARPEKNEFHESGPRRAPLVTAETHTARWVRWRAFREVYGTGILLEPTNRKPVADIIALGDADQHPGELCMVPPFVPDSKTLPFAAQLAAQGCRVLVPVLVNRAENGYAMSNREWLHRPAWELGRTLAGYEVQKILAAVDCFKAASPSETGKIGVAGWGEGGRLALYAAALDERIDGAAVGGYFGSRARVWDEPADRTVFGLLHGHSDAEIAGLIVPRPLLIGHGRYPAYGFRLDGQGNPERLNRGAGKRGKPGKIPAPSLAEVTAELEKIPGGAGGVELRDLRGDAESGFWTALPARLGATVSAGGDGKDVPGKASYGEPAESEADVARRHAGQVAEIDRHNQWALIDSQRVRAEYVKGLNMKSLEQYEASTKPLKERFSKEVIGEFASLQELPAPNARSRGFQEGAKTVSYEVVLDVREGVFAYGILTLPKDLKRDGSEKRPVVVCQHGLEGRPQSTVGEPDYHYYKAFATRLAERGFVTFSPQNIYIGQDKFRILQFKANAVGCTLYSIMVPQHRQITNWLASLPYVDAGRIGFYGLSYGGKTAMRVPPLVDRYCLSICSADFNEWIWKNAATDPRSLRHSYANKGEYEIFEFDLGNTFNYYEMAALIAPRPFMVERGHFDGVAPDETVGYEYAKVRFLYAARLGIGDRSEIEWFVGPHTINGVGTYEFLHRHLKWPKR